MGGKKHSRKVANCRRTQQDTVTKRGFLADTNYHLHTYLSGDTYTLGTIITPDQDYRFAKGETIRATGGDDVRIRRPLDFLMVVDHAENLGMLPALVADLVYPPVGIGHLEVVVDAQCY